MSNLKFAETHNLVAFLEKPKENDGFEEIIDFLNASYVQYALTVNPTIYTTCIEQFWASASSSLRSPSRQEEVFLDKQVKGITKHKRVYVTPSHTKKVFANMKKTGKGFSRRVTPLFPTIMIQASEDMGEDSAASSDSHSTPIISQPSSSKPQKKKSRIKQRKDSGPTEHVTDEAHVSTPSYDPP
ncbi:hypothetical protein Tco_0800752 [Tanacetum coccineum]|uniref:Uncharacterized protein n=1 Tax=Tanacetum coccineum TaxID=301880 RepID=A0ABQ4ZU16_9ASTR